MSRKRDSQDGAGGPERKSRVLECRWRYYINNNKGACWKEQQNSSNYKIRLAMRKCRKMSPEDILQAERGEQSRVRELMGWVMLENEADAFK